MEKGIPVADLEYCRYQLGWAYYRGEQYDKAAECLGLVITRIARFEPEIGATACWLQHDCYLKQDDSDPANIKNALAALDNLVNRFPDSTLAKRARLQMVKLQRSKMGSDEALKKLRDAVASSPEDSSSRYELCLASYRRYLELISKKQDSESVQKEVLQLVGQLDEASSKLTPSQRLKLVLIQLDIQFRTNPRDREKLDRLLAKMAPLVPQVDNTSLVAETHFRQHQIARERGDAEEEQRHAAWLVENGDGTVYQKSVLVRRVQQIEQELAKVSEAGARRELVKQAIDVYQKLARSIGYHVQGVFDEQERAGRGRPDSPS